MIMNTNVATHPIRDLARSLRLGVLLYRLYYGPKQTIDTALRWGVLNTFRTNYGKKQMEAAVFQLNPVSFDSTQPEFDIYYMSGQKYWYQTCFCAYSMSQTSKYNLRPIIHDDGSLTEIQIQEILRIFPTAKIVSLAEVEARLDQVLPVSQFPYLRERRLKQPLIRKLIDFHAGTQGWKLFLDSDMLFFHPPTFLLEWLASPELPCYMVDIQTAYGYPRSLLTELAGTELADLINIGILGLKSEAIDWERLESWLKTLLEQEGTHYNVTQGLTATWLAGKACAIAPAEEYIVLPTKSEVLQPQAALHHYVADSKPLYFRHAWKHIFSKPQRH
jgi:hypothetical protein